MQKDYGGIIIVSFENETRKRILNYNDVVSLGNTLITNFIELYDLNDKKVIEFPDTINSYDDFDIIERIYYKKFIGYNEFNIKKNKDIIDYYCIDYSNILFDENTIEYRLKQKKEYILDRELPLPDVIICDKETEYLNYIDEIKKKSLPYVPFTVIFAEGSREVFGPEASVGNYKHMEMDSIFAYFGENKAIYKYNDKEWFLHKIGYYDCENIYLETYIEMYETEEKIKKEIDDLDCSDISEDDSETDILEKKIEKKFYKYMSEGNIREFDIKLIEKNFYMTKIWTKFRNNIAGYSNRDDLKKGEEYDDNNDIKTDDKIIITRDDYEKIDKRIKELNLFGYLKNNLKSINFDFIQDAETTSESLCNESAYDKFTYLCVYGLMKIE